MQAGPEAFRFLTAGGRLAWYALLLAAVLTGCNQQPGSERPQPPDRGASELVPHRNGRSPSGEGPRSDPGSAESPVQLVELAEQAGVRFTYRNGQEAEHASILESLGGGVALLDYDGNGLLDLFLPGGGTFGPGPDVQGHASGLFRNQGDWQFGEVTVPAGLAEPRHYSHGAIVGDYDADGFPDVLVTGYGGLVLYRNQGDGTFQEVTAEAGLDDRLWSSSAAWGDLDGDGHLDLYVVHYVDWSFDNHPYCQGPAAGQREVCPPRQFAGQPDLVYMSNGDGTFRDASQQAGLRRDGKGLGVVIADLDLSGHCDIYVANDTEPNFLYRNDGRGQFQEVGPLSGTSVSDQGLPEGSMGVDVGDYNRDGLPDLWVTNYERESIALYRNEGDGFFQHVSQPTGITAVGGRYVGWGAVFFDADRDGYEDVFVANGHVIRFPTNAPLQQKPLLFRNLQGRRFENIAAGAGTYCTQSHMGRGVAVGDLDNDGRLDLVVSHINQPVALLANQSADQHHWIGLRLIGLRSHRDAVGARVRLRNGQEQQTRFVKGGASYASSNDPRVFFGLADASLAGQIDIRWPSGSTQQLRDVPANQLLVVHERP